MMDKKGPFVHFLVTQKFRFDLGISFIVFLNFALLAITASEKVQMLFGKIGIEFDVYSIIAYVIIFAFLCTWLFGYILDKIIKYQENMMTVQNTRNPQIMETLANTIEIKKALEEKFGIKFKEFKMDSLAQPQPKKKVNKNRYYAVACFFLAFISFIAFLILHFWR